MRLAERREERTRQLSACFFRSSLVCSQSRQTSSYARIAELEKQLEDSKKAAAEAVDQTMSREFVDQIVRRGKKQDGEQEEEEEEESEGVSVALRSDLLNRPFVCFHFRCFSLSARELTELRLFADDPAGLPAPVAKVHQVLIDDTLQPITGAAGPRMPASTMPPRALQSEDAEVKRLEESVRQANITKDRIKSEMADLQVRYERDMGSKDEQINALRNTVSLLSVKKEARCCGRQITESTRE